MRIKEYPPLKLVLKNFFEGLAVILCRLYLGRQTLYCYFASKFILFRPINCKMYVVLSENGG